MRGFSSFIRRRKLLEQLEETIERAMAEELRDIGKENGRKLEKMKRDITRWARGGDEFKVVEKRFLSDRESMGNCITVDEGDVMSYDEFVHNFLSDLFTCIEGACVYYPLDLAKGKGYSIERELDLSMEEITDEVTAREVVRKGIPVFDYRIKGDRLTVEFYTYYYITDSSPEREWIVIEKLFLG